MTHRLESRMREIRQSGSEGGVADNGHPYPYQLPLPAFAAPWASCHLPGRAMSLKASTSTVPDRSEIGPYV